MGGVWKDFWWRDFILCVVLLISESAGRNSQLWKNFYLVSTDGSSYTFDDIFQWVSTIPVSNFTQFWPLDLKLWNSKWVVLRLEVVTPVFTLTSSYLVILKELVEFQVAKMKHFESTFQCLWNRTCPLSTLGDMSLTMGRGHCWFAEHTHIEEILCKQPWMSFSFTIEDLEHSCYSFGHLSHRAKRRNQTPYCFWIRIPKEVLPWAEFIHCGVLYHLSHHGASLELT